MRAMSPKKESEDLMSSKEVSPWENEISPVSRPINEEVLKTEKKIEVK